MTPMPALPANVKHCPFCGEYPMIDIGIYGLRRTPPFYVLTHPDNGCILADFESAAYSSREELIEDWNRRVDA